MSEPGSTPSPPKASPLASPGRGVLANRGLFAPGADLRGAHLAGQDLSAANLMGADLRRADLRGAILHGTRLRGARLDGADLDGAVGQDLDLEGASLVGARLVRAHLPDACLQEAVLREADLNGCTLAGADLRDASLNGACLDGANLSRAALGGADLTGVLATGTTWTKAHIRGARGLSETSREALLAAGAWEGVGTPELAPALALMSSVARPFARSAVGAAGRARSEARSWWLDQQKARKAAALTRAEERARAARQRLGEVEADRAAPADAPPVNGEPTTRPDRASRATRPDPSERASAAAQAAQRFAEQAARVRAERDEAAAQLRAELASGPQIAVDAVAGRAPRMTVAELEPWLSRAEVELARHNLAGHDLRGVRWEAADLRGAAVDGARLDRAILRGARLEEADLSQALLYGADLRGAQLQLARLVDTDLRLADLRDADLSGANLAGADLRGARLRGTRLNDTNLSRTQLTDLDLSDCSLDGAILDQADLTGARLIRVSAQGARLGGALGLTPAQRIALMDAGATEATGAVAEETALALLQAQLRPLARRARALGLDPVAEARIAWLGLRSRLEEGRARLLQRSALRQSQASVREEARARAQQDREREAAGELDRQRSRERAREADLRAVEEANAEAEGVAREVATPAAPSTTDARPKPAKRPPKPPRSEARSEPRPVAAPVAAVGGPGADLSGADLRGKVLDEVDWQGTILTRAVLAGASLLGADLRQAQAELVDLSGAKLSGARCSELNAPRSQLVDADLRRIDLSGADLFQADLSGADLRGASLRGLDLREANLTAARLSDLDLSEVRLDGAILDQADLAGSYLAHASWKGADVRGALGLNAEQRGLLLDLGAIESSPLPDARALLALGVGAARRLGGALRESAETRRRAVATRAEREQLARPSGIPGLDLSGQDLSGRHLDGVDWRGASMGRARLEAAQLQGADLRDARAEEASFSRARLLEANLAGMHAARARFVDADLRRTDLRGAVLASADLTGADLRGALLEGLDLSGADMTATRLSDLDLRGVVLNGAVLDQADLAGTDLTGASLDGADLRGALGLSGRQREQLAAAGARVTDSSLRELLAGLRPRQLAAAAAIVALGLGSYGAARLIGPTTGTVGSVSAADVRALPPAEALARFEELAEDAVLPQERVGWLLEAAAQAGLLGDAETQERLLRTALTEAGEDIAAGAEARLSLGTLLAELDRDSEALALVDPLLDLVQQPPEQRAKAVLLYQRLAEAEGIDPTARLEALIDGLSGLPDAAAELFMALASARSARGETAEALAALDRAEAGQLSDSTLARVLETRARVHDRAGDLDAAALAYRQMASRVEAGTAAWQVARLSLADVLGRNGQTAEADLILAELVAEGNDEQVRIRAYIAQARAAENAADLPQAAAAWQAAIGLAQVDPEMANEARLSLARLVSGNADDPSLAEFFATMDPEAKAMVDLQARLGQARELLESGAGAEAVPLLKALLESDGLDTATRRDALLSMGEALAQEGEMGQALAIWRDLLSESTTGDDRVHLQLRMADGLLDAGRLEDAEKVLTDLQGNTDADVAAQGKLGMGRLALARGERERARQAFAEVARLSKDPAWKVRALEELAGLAEEGADLQAVIEAWQAVIDAAPPGHPAASRARMATVNRLGAAGRLGEASAACTEAIRAATSSGEKARAILTCAEIDERSGDPAKALTRYEAATAMALAGEADLVLDATSGLARTALAQGRADLARDATEKALGAASDPAVRIELLDLRIQALEALGQDASQARQARTALLAQVPGAAAAALVEQAFEARAGGDLGRAVTMLEQARDAAIDPEAKADILLELGDARLESGAPDLAIAAWREARQTTPDDERVAFQSGMGEAAAALRAGDPARSATLLSALRPPDEDSRRQLAEARATALSQAGDEGAVAAWEEAAATAGDAEARSSALRGQADALFGLDRFDEALRLYEQAVTAAPDATSRGWALLGAIEARLMLKQDAAELALEPLRGHADPEVALQAAIRRSQLRASAEDWATALQVLPDGLPSTLGPAWDVALTLARAAALEGSGQPADAQAELEALTTRWPRDEEAAVQSLLARARIARTNDDEARAIALAREAATRATDPALQAQVEDFVAETAGE